ncbi:hypothetical protein F5884DRAFT_145506 [Xylogone sp. PMI_703]|nr:hypothetical protein F5884DRAFT_145506 [Xylogone sp. PMI_703]
MSGLLSYLPFYRAPRPLREVIPTDEILPVHFFDDTANLHGIVMVWTFRFDEVLDPEKLNEALCILFEKEGWRRLGGRWRQRPDGKLEIHVPKSFTKERQPVHFTKQHHDMAMNEHPLAGQLPKGTGRTETYPSPRNFLPFGIGPGQAHEFHDFLSTDIPQFALHVVTFTDGTLVSISHSHMTTDLLGLNSVISAWSLTLAGKDEAVPPLAGYKDDGMKDLWDPPAKEQHLLAGTELTGWRLAYWATTSIYEAWRSSPEQRILCVPKQTMDNLVRGARMHLENRELPGSSGNEVFISQGDILAALICRMIAQNQPASSTRNIMTWMALDPRTRIKSFDQQAVYVQNSPTAVFFSCPANRALELPLGKLALVVREAVAAQATEEQLKAYTCLSMEAMKTSGSPVMFGDKDMAFHVMSNWLKANLFDTMDFSPAIVKEKVSKTADSKRGHPTYYHATDPGKHSITFLVHLVVVMGMDHNGDTWLSAVLPSNIWSNMLDYLRSFD